MLPPAIKTIPVESSVAVWFIRGTADPPPLTSLSPPIITTLVLVPVAAVAEKVPLDGLKISAVSKAVAAVPSVLPPSTTIISAPGVRSRRFDRNGRINSASLKTGIIMETCIEDFG